jgi:hypothetical protein
MIPFQETSFVLIKKRLIMMPSLDGSLQQRGLIIMISMFVSGTGIFKMQDRFIEVRASGNRDVYFSCFEILES